jgi:hypothetical protein
MLDGQAFEGLDCGFGCVLRLQVPLENVNVIINPLQALAPDDVDAPALRRRRRRARGWALDIDKRLEKIEARQSAVA